MVGAEAAEARHLLDISYPVREGIVTNWEEMEHIWKYTFQDQLGVEMSDLGDHNILITEPPLNPVKNRAKMLEVVFEKYGFGGCRVSTQAVLVLYAQGLMSGLVVDSGDGVTHVIPVAEGYVIGSCIKHVPLAGSDITKVRTIPSSSLEEEPSLPPPPPLSLFALNSNGLDIAILKFFLKMLKEREPGFPSENQLEVAKKIKEKYAYCCEDVAKEFARYVIVSLSIVSLSSLFACLN